MMDRAGRSGAFKSSPKAARGRAKGAASTVLPKLYSGEHGTVLRSLPAGRLQIQNLGNAVLRSSSVRLISKHRIKIPFES